MTPKECYLRKQSKILKDLLSQGGIHPFTKLGDYPEVLFINAARFGDPPRVCLSDYDYCYHDEHIALEFRAEHPEVLSQTIQHTYQRNIPISNCLVGIMALADSTSLTM